MTKRLRDGETRQMKPLHSLQKDLPVVVKAHRVDSDTPYVIVKLRDGEDVWLEDSYARELAYMIGKALAVLPTSK